MCLKISLKYPDSEVYHSTSLSFYVIITEPAEKMYGVSDDKIIESITICDGIVKSTIDDVTEVAHSVSLY